MDENQSVVIAELKTKIAELENKLETNQSFKNEVRREELSPLHDLYTWRGPDRIATSDKQSWYTTTGVIAVITVILALLTENFMLVVVVLAVLFLVYALNSRPPQTITSAITNKGLRIADELYLWKDIEYFWISERSGQLVINIHLKEFKGRLVLPVGNGDINKIVTELAVHEDYREPKGMEAFISRLIEGRQKKFTDFGNHRSEDRENPYQFKPSE